MTASDAALVRLSAAIATADAQVLAATIDRAAVVAHQVAIEEAILQSYLFAGYPAALEAMRAWRTRSGVPAPASAAGDEADWPERGAQVCAIVYGGQYERLRGNVAALHPELERWMVVEGYGKVLGRPGLPLRTRELCIVALLAGQSAPTQLYAHLRGALNAGAAVDDIELLFEEIAGLVEAGRVRDAREVWRAVRARRDGSVTPDKRA